jgi:uncharacterized protein with FMN-binding domain
VKRASLAIVSTVAALVMLLSFKSHTQKAVATPEVTVSTGTTSASPSTSSGSAAKKSSTPAATTFTGAAADTRYGPVQVQITVKNGKVTAVTAVEYPTSDPRDAQINAYAIPALNSEATSAGTASIDMISGATYTSEGYLSSLQSALDQAGL